MQCAIPSNSELLTHARVIYDETGTETKFNRRDTMALARGVADSNPIITDYHF